jgi:hypothetical protein
MSMDLSRLRKALAAENELRTTLARALTPAMIVTHQQEWAASWAACQEGVDDLRVALDVAADLADQLARQLRAYAHEFVAIGPEKRSPPTAFVAWKRSGIQFPSGPPDKTG